MVKAVQRAEIPKQLGDADGRNVVSGKTAWFVVVALVPNLVQVFCQGRFYQISLMAAEEHVFLKCITIRPYAQNQVQRGCPYQKYAIRFRETLPKASGRPKKTDPKVYADSTG